MKEFIKPEEYTVIASNLSNWIWKHNNFYIIYTGEIQALHEKLYHGLKHKINESWDGKVGEMLLTWVCKIMLS